MGMTMSQKILAAHAGVASVKAGDLIEVTFGNRPIKVRVLSDVEPRTKDVAREMYEILSE